MASILCDLKSDRIREKEEKKKRATEAEESRSQKSEENQVRENEDKLRGLESCEALVRYVLTLAWIISIPSKSRSFGCFFAITLGWKG